MAWRRQARDNLIVEKGHASGCQVSQHQTKRCLRWAAAARAQVIARIASRLGDGGYRGLGLGLGAEMNAGSPRTAVSCTIAAGRMGKVPRLGPEIEYVGVGSDGLGGYIWELDIQDLDAS